jgi:hypothetical protein
MSWMLIFQGIVFFACFYTTVLMITKLIACIMNKKGNITSILVIVSILWSIFYVMTQVTH